MTDVVFRDVAARQPVPKRKAQGKGRGYEVWIGGRWIPEAEAHAAGLLGKPLQTLAPFPITRRQAEPEPVVETAADHAFSMHQEEEQEVESVKVETVEDPVARMAAFASERAEAAGVAPDAVGPTPAMAEAWHLCHDRHMTFRQAASVIGGITDAAVRLRIEGYVARQHRGWSGPFPGSSAWVTLHGGASATDLPPAAAVASELEATCSECGTEFVQGRTNGRPQVACTPACKADRSARLDRERKAVARAASRAGATQLHANSSSTDQVPATPDLVAAEHETEDPAPDDAPAVAPQSSDQQEPDSLAASTPEPIPSTNVQPAAHKMSGDSPLPAVADSAQILRDPIQAARELALPEGWTRTPTADGEIISSPADPPLIPNAQAMAEAMDRILATPPALDPPSVDPQSGPIGAGPASPSTCATAGTADSLGLTGTLTEWGPLPADAHEFDPEVCLRCRRFNRGSGWEGGQGPIVSHEGTAIRRWTDTWPVIIGVTPEPATDDPTPATPHWPTRDEQRLASLQDVLEEAERDLVETTAVAEELVAAANLATANRNVAAVAVGYLKVKLAELQPAEAPQA